MTSNNVRKLNKIRNKYTSNTSIAPCPQHS